jgi:hypothetical protein
MQTGLAPKSHEVRTRRQELEARLLQLAIDQNAAVDDGIARSEKGWKSTYAAACPDFCPQPLGNLSLLFNFPCLSIVNISIPLPECW